nr:MAG: hypothetical protein [Bacteriophage sp.]
MWIRSQNKRILSNVDEVLVTFVDENKCFLSGFWGTGTDTLGVYSSKEKAFKVLDEIQSVIMYNQLCVIDKAPRGSYVFNKGAQVYQMPQDEDVIV